MRGIFLGVPQAPFVILGAIAIAIGWVSFFAMRQFPTPSRRG
jgi:hypothetical protein